MLTHKHIYPYETELELFFEKNQKSLEKSYPGLQLSSLLRELESIDVDSYHRMSELKQSLMAGVPLEYLSERSYFYKSEFYVNSSVLIPRSETEILVEMALKEMSHNVKIRRILDVGCGSGIIGLTIAQEISTPLIILLSDISSEALQVAKRNLWEHSYRINPVHQIEFIQSDLLDTIDAEFDMIVSNPPYIKTKEDKGEVHPQVLQYEPHLALFIDDSAYQNWFYRFFSQVESALCSGGIFLMEGHENHLEHLRGMMSEMNFCDIEIIKDYTQRPRFIKAKRI